MFAKEGANLVPIAVPLIYLNILPAKWNMLCLRMVCMNARRWFLGTTSSGNLS